MLKLDNTLAYDRHPPQHGHHGPQHLRDEGEGGLCRGIRQHGRPGRNQRNDCKSSSPRAAYRRRKQPAFHQGFLGAGVIFDDFCAWAAEKGLWGVENLSHIPGETGAAAVQNIGAYGVEIKDVIDKVNCYDMVLGREVSFKADECGYGYRDSLFKRDRKGRYIVTSVTFRLSANAKPVLDYGHIRSAVESSLTDRGVQEGSAPSGAAIQDGIERRNAFPGLTPSIIRNVIVGIRKSKLPEPSEMGSAGSFFKNPVVPKSDYDRVASIATLYNGAGCSVPHYDMGSGFVKIPAAWLIEQCGWKGHPIGVSGLPDGGWTELIAVVCTRLKHYL